VNPARVIGIAGWSGAGKTTLIVKLIPMLRARGLRIATVKRAHHKFDVDQPGKDSYEHRKAGAFEVIVSSERRWVQMHEIGEGAEATLAELLQRLSPCDLVLIEGFKGAPHPKLEVYRHANAKEPLHPTDDRIVAIASDTGFPDAKVPVVDLEDVAGIADLVWARAEPMPEVLRRLGMN
jgi:molybdopterin-guanine dinucleotide biosynthesis adapter protein